MQQLSKFNEDLQKEQILAQYLDEIYTNIGLDFERMYDLESQYRGIDLKINHKGKTYSIDEKAQLDYLDRSLPTFAFELSYYKDEKLNLGWLYDAKKVTDYYFLVTSIHVEDNNISKGIKSCQITSVNRKKLIQLLQSRGIEMEMMLQLQNEIRNSAQEKNIPITQLNQKSEGCLFYSTHIAEKPINLKLYLDFLKINNVAKEVYKISTY